LTGRRASPDGAPGVTRDHLLKFAVEIVGGGNCFVHVRRSQDGAADFKSRLQRIAGRPYCEARVRAGSSAAMTSLAENYAGLPQD
jgi:hypothetical protein